MKNVSNADEQTKEIVVDVYKPIRSTERLMWIFIVFLTVGGLFLQYYLASKTLDNNANLHQTKKELETSLVDCRVKKAELAGKLGEVTRFELREGKIFRFIVDHVALFQRIAMQLKTEGVEDELINNLLEQLKRLEISNHEELPSEPNKK